MVLVVKLQTTSLALAIGGQRVATAGCQVATAGWLHATTICWLIEASVVLAALGLLPLMLLALRPFLLEKSNRVARFDLSRLLPLYEM